MIDNRCAKYLRLGEFPWLQPIDPISSMDLVSPSSGPSLFSVLNHTNTTMGGRLLKLNILQPSSGWLTHISGPDCRHLDRNGLDMVMIEERLDAIGGKSTQ